MQLPPEDATMLALAVLAYLGVSHPDLGHSDLGHGSRDTIARELEPWLEKLRGTEIGSWDLVWGPATFHAAIELFDASMMYVVKERGSPRYVVAIRGTNPVSLVDWFLGDMWVRHKVPWKKEMPHARISASTALGLATLKQLTDREHASEESPGPMEALSARVALPPAPAATRLRSSGGGRITAGWPKR